MSGSLMDRTVNSVVMSSRSLDKGQGNDNKLSKQPGLGRLL